MTSVSKVSNEYRIFKAACIAQAPGNPLMMKRVQTILLGAKNEAENQKLSGDNLAEYFSQALTRWILNDSSYIQDWFIDNNG